MTAPARVTPEEDWDLPGLPPPADRRSWSVRGRLWTLAVLALLLTMAASGGSVLAADRLRAAAQRAGQAASEAFAAADLYGSLGEMDGRLAEYRR